MMVAQLVFLMVVYLVDCLARKRAVRSVHSMENWMAA
jgi:septation ring formation regulator EzrA